jgi:hypothetical protein
VIDSPSCSKYSFGSDRALYEYDHGLVDHKQRRGAPKMQTPDLTRWLEMVWDALSEPDGFKRDHLLRSADVFLQGSNRQADSALPFVDDDNAAA